MLILRLFFHLIFNCHSGSINKYEYRGTLEVGWRDDFISMMQKLLLKIILLFALQSMFRFVIECNHFVTNENLPLYFLLLNTGR